MATTNTDRIQDLEKSSITIQADFVYLKQAVIDLTNTNRESDAKVAELEKEIALLKQRLDDHIKRMDTWSSRLWGFIMLLIGAVLSLASGLIVTLARK